MTTINLKIDYNSVRTTNPKMGSEALAHKSRYILKNKDESVQGVDAPFESVSKIKCINCRNCRCIR